MTDEDVAGAAAGRRRRLAALVAAHLTVTLGLAVLANLALDESLARGQGANLWDDGYDRSTGLFVLGTAVLWMVVLGVDALVANLAATAALAGAATAIAAFANYEKLTFRHEPLYPGDLRFAADPAFLTEMVGARVLVLLAVGLLVTAGACVVGYRLYRSRVPRAPRVRDRDTRRAVLGVRLVTAVGCLLALDYLGHFNAPGNVVHQGFEDAGATWSIWNQEVNYDLNGFVGGFLFNMPVPAMAAPPGYGRAEMARLVSKYAAVADRVNRGRDPHALDDVNVVMVLSESFSDPTLLEGLAPVRDPIPFTRHLMRTSTSGRMLARGIGGGTSDMEFELLTGMSMSQFAPQLSNAYQMLVPRYAHFPSAVGYFKGLGHDTVAIHPYEPSMYRRTEVYASFGFDRFLHAGTMRHRDEIEHNPRISDDAAFREVTDQIEQDPTPLLVHLVTVQNHMPYRGQYAHPERPRGLTGSDRENAGQYLRGLTYSDRALRSFIGRLRQSDEKTVVLFYGDHLPSAYPPSLLARNTPRRTHETPFFVWSNFASPRHQEPTTSPWGFMDLVLERAGAPVPPYFALLERLHQQVPAMEGDTVVDGGDRTTTPAGLGRRARAVLRDYRMVQYDLSVGHRYAQAGLFYPEAKPASAPGE